MENAVEALKIFLATAIFAIALTVFFRMTSLAKDTADIVFSAIDKTTLINYDANEADGANRIVTFQEIMPTIYRYAQEGYGVTIIDPSTANKIVARFDLDTESQVSSCFWTQARYNAAGSQVSGVAGVVQTEAQKKSNSIKYEMTKYLNENIFRTVGITEINLGDEAEKETNSNHEELDAIIRVIYASGGDDAVYTGWLRANTYNNNYITQRVNSDIYGQTTNFSLINPGVHEENLARIAGTHNPCVYGGLLERYKEENGYTFTEYIVQIDRNEYIQIDGENTELLIFGTLRNMKKREIIYVVR